MPTVIRKTTAADNNLPSIVGSASVTVQRHADGALAGHTSVTGPARALRHLSGRWRAPTVEETAQLAGPTGEPAEPEEEGNGHDFTEAEIAWGQDLTGGTVAGLESALLALNGAKHTPRSVEVLLHCEHTGKDRSTAVEAIEEWGDLLA